MALVAAAQSRNTNGGVRELGQRAKEELWVPFDATTHPDRLEASRQILYAALALWDGCPEGGIFNVEKP